MKVTEIKPLILSLSTDQQARLLSRLANNLTVCARSASLPEVQDASARKKFRGINELLHVVTSQVSHIVSGNQNRYPNDVFADLLLEIASAESCEGDLAQAVGWSCSALGQARELEPAGST